MQWIFRRIIERLAVKLIAMMGSEWDARVEMHLSETRAELLRRAKQLEAEETLGPTSAKMNKNATSTHKSASSDPVDRISNCHGNAFTKSALQLNRLTFHGTRPKHRTRSKRSRRTT